jgi:hypothetical protein
MKMTRLAKIKQIRILAHMIKENLTTDNLTDLIFAQNEMERLIIQFHEEFPDLMTAGQFRAAKDDYDAFLKILDAAYAQETEKSGKMTEA